MAKTNKTYDSTILSIDLKDTKLPLQEMANSLDTSIGWLVRKMVREHPSMDHIKEKGQKATSVAVK